MARKSSKKSASKSSLKPSPQARRKASAKPAAPASRKTVKKSAKAARPAGPVATLQEGDLAPDFTLQRDGDLTLRLADFTGRKLVIFFYPRADTPGCTLEAVDFSRLKSRFEEAGTSIVGISADEVRAQTKFRDKHKLSVPLGADADLTTVTAYGVWGEKSMYGRTFLGIVRTTILVGPDGRIARIWRNVKVDGHAAEVLKIAQAL
ncbi:peroxiredoxin [Bradyrhizobium sp. LHD-71]|uniref:peroxiredoxin n=1 Tax=Bradyrhizobium sp. LHD-71 TaxID=3072141 RepID=UPI00280F2C4A|nr:peroxiredoxin [Bradyrhizobium sp. LHD-71]MDQ8729998.1 peroxiredoxin [Bradyrhizobium sp. LHD-71]